MFRVRLIENPFELDAYSEHEVPSLLPFLQERFTTWPETARLYEGVVSASTDVTPRYEEDVEYLEGLTEGDFYVVVYPGYVFALIVAVVALVASIVMMLFMAPKIPKADQESANNTLGERTNKPRPNQRVPDIYGTVISIPELLTVPLLTFANNVEREISYMCIGRGSYDVTEVKDGDTPIANISGASAEFYGPNNSPASGTTFLTVGPTITTGFYNPIRLNEVNGQILRPPNSNQVNGNNNIRFVYPDTIQGSGTDFTDNFVVGDDLVVTSASFSIDDGSLTRSKKARCVYPNIIEFTGYNPVGDFVAGWTLLLSGAYFSGLADDGVTTLAVDLSGTYTISSVNSTQIVLSSPSSVNSDWADIDDYPGDETPNPHSVTVGTPGNSASVNLNGTYEILSVSATSIVLSSPNLVNPDWDEVQDLPGGATDYISPTLATSANNLWVGPFIIDMDTCSRVFCNFVAPQGMYRATKKGKYLARSVQVQYEVTPVDANDNPTGTPQTFNITLSGNGQDRSPLGVTLQGNLTSATRCQVRARRVTNEDVDTEDTVVDEVKWRDCYGAQPIFSGHFGNVTTVRVQTIATAGAMSVKERKFNCRVTRKLLQRNTPGNTFGPSLIATDDAAHIICNMALDSRIGGRTLSELDVQQIFDTVAEIETYFGIAEVGTFSHTFDDLNISFEEMVQTVANAIFCNAYRVGNKIRLKFERETEDSILLFNHRNKVPRTETRTVRFGRLNDHDGVEVDYTSPDDGAKLTIYIPSNQSAVRPKKFELTGVDSEAHAFLHAARAWNKIKYQNISTRFDALSEASQLVLTDRIEVADNTRPDVHDGEVVSQDGLVIELSQPFTPAVGVDYVIQLQSSTGVEVIDITPGADEYHVVLQAPPSEPLSLDPDAAAKTVYQIVGDNVVRSSAFLLTERGAYDKKTVSVTAVNYDPRYYADDFTYA